MKETQTRVIVPVNGRFAGSSAQVACTRILEMGIQVEIGNGEGGGERGIFGDGFSIIGAVISGR